MRSMQLHLIVLFGALLSITAVSRLSAHHAFASEFDANRPVKLKGKVTKVEWINPHMWIHIEVPKPGGGAEEWSIEGAAPSALLRRGVTREALAVGTEILVEGFQARDRINRANGRAVTIDGKMLFLGSSGTGAPLDGRDSSETGGKGAKSNPGR